MPFDKQQVKPSTAHPWQTSARFKTEVYKEILTTFPTAVDGYHRSSVLDVSDVEPGSIELVFEPIGDPAEYLRVHVGGIYSLDSDAPDTDAIKTVSSYYDCLVGSRLVIGVNSNAPYIIFLFEDAETDCTGVEITATFRR